MRPRGSPPPFSPPLSAGLFVCTPAQVQVTCVIPLRVTAPSEGSHLAATSAGKPVSGPPRPASMTYSLAAQCGSEIIASALVIYIGESIIANELLAKTKVRRNCAARIVGGYGASAGHTSSDGLSCS